MLAGAHQRKQNSHNFWRVGTLTILATLIFSLGFAVAGRENAHATTPAEPNTWTLLAAGERTAVFSTASDYLVSTGSNLSNGTYWYFGGYAKGFAPSDTLDIKVNQYSGYRDAKDLATCTSANKGDQRLSVEVNPSASGGARLWATIRVGCLDTYNTSSTVVAFYQANNLPSYYPSGPQSNVSNTLTGNGWTICSIYNFTSDQPLVSNITNACSQRYILMAANASYQSAPTVSTFSSITATPRNDSNASYSVVFSQSVTGLTTDDIENAGTAATGCSYSLTGSGTTYTLSISSCSDGTIQPRIKANSVSGSAFVGPASAATATSTITKDSVAPTPTATTETITAGNSGVFSLGSTGPGGGKVFHVSSSGFACGPTLSQTCHYLEAAPTSGASAWSDGSRNTVWSGNTNTATGATGTAIGTGYKNTLAIISQNNTSDRAASKAQAYRGPNNFSDWYLPSKDELIEMYSRKSDLSLVTDDYWSSSESSATKAWYYYMGSATWNNDTSKGDGLYVRAIRSFARNHVVVRSSEAGSAYLVNETVNVSNLASITSAADNLQNYVSVSTANTDTNLSIAGLISGTYKLYTVDGAGNLSAASASTITIKPAGPGTPDLKATSDLGTSDTDNSTSDDTPTFDVSSIEIGTEVILTATPSSGIPVTCSFVAASTSGSCTFTSLGNSTYSITAVQSRSGINSDTSTALANVVINKTTISTPATPDLHPDSDTGISNSDNLSKDNTPTISVSGPFTGTGTVTAIQAGSSVSCTLSSGAYTCGTLSDGVWSITVKDQDTAGNSTTSIALSITIDTAQPIANMEEALTTSGTPILIRSSEKGRAYLVIRSMTNASVATITARDGREWNVGDVPEANVDTVFSTDGLLAVGPQCYILYTEDDAGNLSSSTNNQLCLGSASAPSGSVVGPQNLANPGVFNVGDVITNRQTFNGVPTPTVTFQYFRCPTNAGVLASTYISSGCVDISGATSSTYTLTGDDVGKYMGVKVTATNSSGSLVLTPSTNTLVTAAKPGAPTSVVPTITGSTTSTVSFTAPASNGGSAITGYTVTSTPSGAVCAAGSSSTIYNCTGLSANTPYTFKVKATNTAGTGDDSAASSSQTTHAAPTIASTPGTATFPRLSNDVFEEFEGPGPSTGITVTVNGVTTPISTNPATGDVSIARKAESWTSTATYGSLSGYMLNFYNSTLAPIITFPSGVSQFRFLVAGLAVQPTILLTYTNGSTSDTLTLNTGGSEAAPYVITITAPSGKFINSFRITPPSQDWWHLDNISYVAALSTTTSVSSKSLTAGTAATSFTPITASGGGSSKTYSISPALPSGLSLNTSTGAITGTPTGATASTSYTVTVNDGSSNSSATFSLGVNAALSSSTGTVPSAVYKDVAVTAFTPVSFSGGTSPVTYSVSPSLPAGLSLNASTGVISGTATGTAPSTTYTVRATDANGDSEESAFAFAVTNQPTAPDAPTIGAATSTGQTTATVAFTAPANTGGAAITTYTVTASPGSITATGSSSPITVTGLTAGTAYTFSITATNAAGLTSSSSSPSSSITTESAPAPSSGGGGGGGSPAPAPEPAPEPVCNTACVAAQNAAAERAAAERAAAERAAVEKAAAEKVAAEKLTADKAAAVAVAEKTKVDVSAAATAATAAVEKATAAAAAKVDVDTVAAAVSTIVNSTNSSAAITNKITNEAAASISSAPAAATKAASTASANTKANSAASQVRAAATAAQKAATGSQAQTSAAPEISLGSSNTGSAAAQAAARANAAARAGKVAANEVAATAEAKAVESKATATALQNEANAAVAEAIAEQKVATALAVEAKAAADKASTLSAEKIAATTAAKTAAEILVELLKEKVTVAEKIAAAVTVEALAEAQKSLDTVNAKIAEAERTVAETASKADAAITAQAEAIEVAEAAKASAEAQLAKVDLLNAVVPVKAAAAVRAASVAAVDTKIATAAKAAAAKVPSSAVISAKPGVSTGKNSTRATISGLKPGQKVKVTVNVKPKP
ncbi:Fibronectin type III [Candidatus Planktophila vernalis]|uniref:beta strand repeat-containing protein n=1 Tax=Candidatus Planktophila vernalis TaxID=1884907 RepID=UPI003CFB8F35